MSRVFDWKKAAEIIRDKNPEGEVSAGLFDCWSETAGTIWENGKPVSKKGNPFLSSEWATPMLSIKQEGGWLFLPCYVDENETDWNEKTRWPPEALTILGIKED